VTIRLTERCRDTMLEAANRHQATLDEEIESRLIKSLQGAFASWDRIDEQLRQLDGYVKRVIDHDTNLFRERELEWEAALEDLRNQRKLLVHGQTHRKRKPRHHAAKADRRTARRRRAAG